MITKTYLKKIGYELTGLEITFSDMKRTYLRTVSDGITGQIVKQEININFDELRIMKVFVKIEDRGFNEEFYELQALLHEIAHYKKVKKYNNYLHFSIDYNRNEIYHENLSDRYARRYYKRMLE